MTRKKKQQPSKSEVVVNGKDKEKGKGKKAGESSKAKGGSKKSRQDVD